MEPFILAAIGIATAIGFVRILRKQVVAAEALTADHTKQLIGALNRLSKLSGRCHFETNVPGDGSVVAGGTYAGQPTRIRATKSGYNVLLEIDYTVDPCFVGGDRSPIGVAWANTFGEQIRLADCELTGVDFNGSKWTEVTRTDRQLTATELYGQINRPALQEALDEVAQAHQFGLPPKDDVEAWLRACPHIQFRLAAAIALNIDPIIVEEATAYAGLFALKRQAYRECRTRSLLDDKARRELMRR